MSDTRGRSDRPGRNGGRLQSGNPGNSGGGRARNECIWTPQALMSDAEVVTEPDAILKDRKPPQWAAVYKLCVAYAHGAPVQHLEAAVTDRRYVVEVPPKLDAEAWRARCRPTG